jgi:Zn-dependent protease with chaperone function
MFAVRGVIIALAVFAVVYCTTSLAMMLTWQKLRAGTLQLSAAGRADALFVFRLLPFASAIFVTAALTVPSFLMFEPRSIYEVIGVVPIGLALFGVVLVLFGAAKGIAALFRASRIVAAWTHGLQIVEAESPVAILQVPDGAPAMMAAGILWPRVLISQAATALLSPNELQAALKHELTHVRRRDNLRKLLLECVPFPGMSGLEAAWLEAAEMAADHRAARNASEALDLAAALIKLSRAVPLGPPAELTAALVHSPSSLVHARVKRLIGWSEESPATGRSVIWYGMSVGAAAVALWVCYGHLLVHVHAASEWLVR